VRACPIGRGIPCVFASRIIHITVTALVPLLFLLVFRLPILGNYFHFLDLARSSASRGSSPCRRRSSVDQNFRILCGLAGPIH
jgi:hypothetical protein